MKAKYPQPRWGLLFLVLPLAVAMFWAIQRLHTSGVAHGLLELGALIIVAGYVEVWQLNNRMALLHHPFMVGDGESMYNVYEVRGHSARQREPGGQPAPLGAFYSDLFPIRERDPVRLPVPLEGVPLRGVPLGGRDEREVEEDHA